MESVFIKKTNKKLHNKNHFLYQHFLFCVPPVLQAGRFCMSFFAAFRFLILNNTAHMRQYAAYGRYFLFYSYNLSYTAPACVIAGTGAKPFTASYIKVPAFAYHRLPPPKHAYPPLPGGRSLTAVQRHHVTRHPL